MHDNSNNTDPLSPDAIHARPLTGRARRLIGAEWLRDIARGTIDPATILRAGTAGASIGIDPGSCVWIRLGADAQPEGSGGNAYIPGDLIACAIAADDHDETEEAADRATDAIIGYALLNLSRPQCALATHCASEYGTGRTLPPMPSLTAELARVLETAGRAACLSNECVNEAQMPRALVALVNAARAMIARQWCNEASATPSHLDAVGRAVAALAMHRETAEALLDPPALAAAVAAYEATAATITARGLQRHARAIAEELAAHASADDPQRAPAENEQGERREHARAAQAARNHQARSDAADAQAQAMRMAEQQQREQERRYRDEAATAATPGARSAATRRANRAREAAEAAARQRERAEQEGREAREAARSELAQAQRHAVGGAAARAEQDGAQPWEGTPVAEAHGRGGEGDPCALAVRSGCAQSNTGEPVRDSESLAVEVVR